MSRIVLAGLNGTNPLGFFAALGLLRVLDRSTIGATLGFLADGSFNPFIETPGQTHATAGATDDAQREALAVLVAEDAARCAGNPAWNLRYDKDEKNGVKVVADLKAPPDKFAEFLTASVERWISGDDEGAAYAAAFGTSIARDGKGNTKPTAFHFTAANQQFLGAVETIRRAVDAAWSYRSLFHGYAGRSGLNLRWDLGAERSWALMASDPNEAGTSVDAPLEWLAFRGLPLFPTFPWRSTIMTTGVTGRSDRMKFTWPLWSIPLSLSTARSVVQLPCTGPSEQRALRGVLAVCTSPIRRTSQGFGNFGPAAVEP